MPQLPQLFESVFVSTHWEPHAICGDVQVMPVPPAPAVPVLPPVPGFPPDGLLHAASRRAKPKPRFATVVVFMILDNSRLRRT